MISLHLFRRPAFTASTHHRLSMARKVGFAVKNVVSKFMGNRKAIAAFMGFDGGVYEDDLGFEIDSPEDVFRHIEEIDVVAQVKFRGAFDRKGNWRLYPSALTTSLRSPAAAASIASALGLSTGRVLHLLDHLLKLSPLVRR